MTERQPKLKKDGTPSKSGRTSTTWAKGTNGAAKVPFEDKPPAPFAADSPTRVPLEFTGRPEVQAARADLAAIKLREKARALARLESEGAPTPLEVLTATMSRNWQAVAELEDALADARADSDPGEIEKVEARLEAARERAADKAAKAAPYLHRKLVDTKNEHAGPDGGPVMTVLEVVFVRPQN